jgi:EAL domain-containing protein (putative c-di-GMP-specific phosphodiesterase class I)
MSEKEVPLEVPLAESRGRVLVADDEREPLRAVTRILKSCGFHVDAVERGEEAARALEAASYDAIVSDISMPGMDGIALLRFIHARDEEAPVILITGAPAVETAMEALEHGAYKYLVKPVAADRLEEVVHKAVQMRRMARIRREAMEVLAAEPDTELRAAFGRAMDTLWIAYQPIVTSAGELFGYEALLRSREPTLPHPGAVIDAAERLGLLDVLGRNVRERAAEPIARDDGRGTLFVNLHPRDLEDEQLVSPASPLARIANRVVLEITERASVTSIGDLRNRIAKLRQTGYRIAVDDLGAGYAGLTSFAMLEPDIVKVDMSLVRDVDKTPVKRRLISSITSLCREMGIRVVGEGVETPAERDVLLELGCDLFQGYLLAKPGEPFPSFTW